MPLSVEVFAVSCCVLRPVSRWKNALANGRDFAHRASVVAASSVLTISVLTILEFGFLALAKAGWLRHAARLSRLVFQAQKALELDFSLVAQ